jgi:hypothetical protein
MGTIRISPTISDDALLFLIDNGLKAQYSKSCESWKRGKSASDKDYELSIKRDLEQMPIELAKGADALKETILRALLDRVSAFFPYVYSGGANYTVVDVVLQHA